MNRTKRAAVSAAFQYTQLGLAAVAGLVVFPLTVRYIGAHDFGLWLATGELANYLLLTDFGVFAAMPWLVAARDGAGDRPGLVRLSADALAVSAVVAVVLGVAAGVVWSMKPTFVDLHTADWETVRVPLTLLIGLTAAGCLLRPFTAVLAGLQDVNFNGWAALGQTVMTVGMTAGLTLSGGGLTGLAIATATPPLLIGLAALVRLRFREPDILRLPAPTVRGIGSLVREGTGPWLSGFGVRLLSGSASLILVALGRTEGATQLAATGKLAQLMQTMSYVLPDSALIGLSHLRAAGQPSEVRRVVLSMLLLYLLTSGVVAFAVLAVNPLAVRLWIGADLYAGDTVNWLVAVNAVTAAAVAGLYKVVAMASYRPAIGLASLAFGGLTVGLSWGLGMVGGLAGVAAGPVIAASVFAIPVGLWLMPRAYPVSAGVLGRLAGRWALRTSPFLLLAGLIAGTLSTMPVACLLATAAAGIGYLAVLRPLIGTVPWPATARQILVRTYLMPRSTAGEVS